MRKLIIALCALALLWGGRVEAQSCDGCGIGYRPSSLGSSGGTLTGPLTVAGTGTFTGTGPDTAPLSSELATNPDFTSDLTGWSGTNWAWNAASGGVARHTAGSVASLTQNISVTNGTIYQITITIANRTAGSVVVTLGGVTLVNFPWGQSFSINESRTLTLEGAGTSSQAFAATPTNDFDGDISTLSVKAITDTSVGILVLKDSSGAEAATIRGSASLSNLAQGSGALRYNTTGGYNSAQGLSALRSNTVGGYNSAQGFSALRSNTTGSYNSAQGSSALYSNTIGTNNSAQGLSALYSNTTGYNNSAQGSSALYSNTTGCYNSAQGSSAGYKSGATPSSANAVTTGTSLTFIGYQSGLGSATQRTNSTAIGFEAYVDADNTVVLGDENVTSVLASSDGGATVTAGAFKVGNNTGITGTVVVKGSDGNNCNLVFEGGIVTSETCP